MVKCSALIKTISLMTIVWLSATTTCYAELKLAKVFGDHMVLQRGKELPVWGMGDNGKAVTVTLGTITKKTLVNNGGKWSISFPSRKASSSPISMTVQSGDDKVTVTDILVGEVWVAAGQSNMEFALKSATNAKQVIAKANYSEIRFINYVGAARGGSGKYTKKHLERLTVDKFFTGTWEVCTPQTVPPLSAVAFFFAHKLHAELDVPIGIIDVAIGGTPCEAWVSREALAADPKLKVLVRGNWLENKHAGKWCRERAKSNFSRAMKEGDEIPGDDLGPNHSFKTTFCFNAGIKPLMPYAIAGAIWYQGESNADTIERINQHHLIFPVMVRDWRKQWGQGDFPFLYVQLPAMGRPNWPWFRQGQLDFLQQLPKVGMGVTIDTGHPTNVHPCQKQSVGERLALWALGTTYSKPIVYSGPLVQSTRRRSRELTVTFNHTGSGLTTSDGQAPNHFEVAGTNEKFYSAKARIVGKSIVLSSDKVIQPVYARYAWSAFPKPTVNLFNKEGLPASPFTTLEINHE